MTKSGSPSSCGINKLPARLGTELLRWAVIGAVSAGVVGGAVGLLLGLRTNASTAWFAIFELGIPSSIVGGVLGLLIGAIAYLVSRSIPQRP